MKVFDFLGRISWMEELHLFHLLIGEWKVKTITEHQEIFRTDFFLLVSNVGTFSGSAHAVTLNGFC